MKDWRLAFGLAALLLPANTEAAEPSRPPSEALGHISDLRLTILARRSLEGDAALAKLNLGVEVRDGVAVAWGPIPDREAGRRAVARLERISGIRNVRPDFHFARVDPDPEQAFAARKVDAALPRPAAPKPRKPVPVAVVGGGLSARIAAIRKTNGRFAGIRTEIEGNSITVHRGDDEVAASLFAQKLQQIGGVEEVFLAAR